MSDHSFAYKPRRRSEKRGANNLSDSVRKEQENPITQASGHTDYETKETKGGRMSDYVPGIADFTTCRLPKVGRLDGGRLARCPYCGLWWRVKFHGSRDWDDCYVSWEHVGWLRLHTQYRNEYKHWKATKGNKS